MPFFSKTPLLPAATAADLQSVHARLVAVDARFDALDAAMATHGVAIHGVPAALTAHMRAEVQDLISDIGRRAWVAAKSEAIERGTKFAFTWALRAALTGATAYALKWVHALLGAGK